MSLEWGVIGLGLGIGVVEIGLLIMIWRELVRKNKHDQEKAHITSQLVKGEMNFRKGMLEDVKKLVGGE